MKQISELITTIQDAKCNLSVDQIEEVLIALQQYRAVMSDALEVVSVECNEVIEFMDDNNLRDSEEDTLTPCERDAWAGLCEALGYDNPLPE